MPRVAPLLPGAQPPARALAVTAGVALTAAAALVSCTATGSRGGGELEFPVTVRRIGGVAGFDDTVVVAADGSTTVTRRGETASCSVPRDVATALAATAEERRGDDRPSPTGADAVDVTIRTREGRARLDAANLPGQAPAVAGILEDLGREPSERTVCR